MSIFDDARNIFGVGNNFVKTANYYFCDHLCEKTGVDERVRLEYKIIREDADEQINFGVCGHCSTVFYAETFYKPQNILQRLIK
jgi:hypothetical protein